MVDNCGVGIGTCGSFLMGNEVEGLDNFARGEALWVGIGNCGIVGLG